MALFGIVFFLLPMFSFAIMTRCLFLSHLPSILCRGCMRSACRISFCFIRWQADKLLSPEFQPVLEQLVNHCAPKRQICLFSATFPVTVKDFKDRHITNPYEINLMDELTLKVCGERAVVLLVIRWVLV